MKIKILEMKMKIQAEKFHSKGLGDANDARGTLGGRSGDVFNSLLSLYFIDYKPPGDAGDA